MAMRVGGSDAARERVDGTELVIVRHGEAVCNVEGIAGGEIGCTGLTPLGREQAVRLADRLAREHAQQRFGAFYATGRRRVSETASAISARLAIDAQVVSDLRNPDHGQADGRRWRDIRATWAGPPRRFPDRPYAPGSETWHGYLRRSTAALRAVIDRHPGQRVLVAGHQETIEAAHAMLMEMPLVGVVPMTFVADHTGISRWRYRVDEDGYGDWAMTVHNDATHLHGLPASSGVPG